MESGFLKSFDGKFERHQDLWQKQMDYDLRDDPENTIEVEIISVDPNCEYSSPNNSYERLESFESTSGSGSESCARGYDFCSDQDEKLFDSVDIGSVHTSYDHDNNNINMDHDTALIEIKQEEDNTNDVINSSEDSLGNGCRRRIYRKSFSLPLSPITTDNNLSFSASFEDLDIHDLVTLSDVLSPLKLNTTVSSELSDKVQNAQIDNVDDILVEEMKETDLINWVEESYKEPQSTFVEKCEVKLRPNPGKSLEKMKREIELEQEQNSKWKSLNESKGDDEIIQPSGARRSCVVRQLSKGYKKLQGLSDSESDDNIDVVSISPKAAADKIVSQQEKEKNIKKDDNIKDPTWSPNSTKAPKIDKKPAISKQSKSKPTVITTSSNLNAMKLKMLNKNQVIVTFPKDKTVKRSDQVQMKDHDYCSPEKRRPVGVSFPKQRTGVGLGKNLSLCIKPDLSSDSEGESSSKTILNNLPPLVIKEEIVETAKGDEIKIEQSYPTIKLENSMQCLPQNKRSAISKDNCKMPIKCEVFNGMDKAARVESEKIMPEKKKLNLQEYKKRREYIVSNINNKNVFNKRDILEKFNSNVTNTSDITSNLINPSGKEVESKYLDPILEAKKKALRMQERKRAATLKLIEVELQAKTASLLPILPLAEMTGTTQSPTSRTDETKESGKPNQSSDYEEIVIVSMGCNTELSIPIEFISTANESIPKPTSKLLHQSSLLSNITDTIIKAKSHQISSNSLLSSIQDIVLKKTSPSYSSGFSSMQTSPNCGVSPPNGCSPGKPEMAKNDLFVPSTRLNERSKCEKSTASEHGEDKIIMHLRKDRIRPEKRSIYTQTDFYPEFPTLTRLEPRKSHHEHHRRISRHNSIRDRHYSHHDNKTSHRERHYSSDSSDSGHGYKRSRHLSNSSNGPHRRSTSPRPNSQCSRYRPRSRSRQIRRDRDRDRDRDRSPHQHRHHSDVKCRKRKLSSTIGTGSSPAPSCNKKHQNNQNNRRQLLKSPGNRRTRSRTISRSPESKRRRYSTDSSRSSSLSSESRSRSRSRSNQRNRSSVKHRRRHDSPEERRIVYVGRIENETTKDCLRRKFARYGPIKQITLHHKETGMKYGFVTFERPSDAYKAIDNGKQDPNINIYDISFGGRRAFCRASYSDLDGAATSVSQNPLLTYPTLSSSSSSSSASSTLIKESANSAQFSQREESFDSLLQSLKKRMFVENT